MSSGAGSRRLPVLRRATELNLCSDLPTSQQMSYRQNIPFRVGKVCALIAAALVLPVLAHANQNNNNNGGNGQNVPTVPDAGPGIALLAATVGSVLLFSASRSARKEHSFQGR